MIIKPEITMGNLISLAGFTIAACGFFLTYIQICKNNAQKRAEFLMSIYHQFTSSLDISDIYYKIEYNRFTYNDQFHESPEERQLDKLLCLFETVAKLYKLNNITRKDMTILEYQFKVIFQNPGVQGYLDFIENWCINNQLIFPYSSFRQVGQMLIDETP